MQPPTNNTQTTPVPKQRHPIRTTLLLVILVGLLGAVVYMRAITDWLALRNYQAPSAISALADQTTMTPEARKIFYVNHPLLEGKVAFSNSCPNNAREKTIVLGCYHGNQHGVYLLDVSDVRLSGVEDVTAAHEMLHAAYDRLSSKDRAAVDTQLQAYYDSGLKDQRIIDTIASYRKSEPKDIVNEMHSIFGTEVANLPAGLEQYYQRYFTNRAQIVAYADAYQAEFTSREATVKQADTQLASLKARIDSSQTDLKARQAAITSTQKTLLAERSSGNTEAYNSGVPGYNAMIDAYNREAEGVRSLIEQYNALVIERNRVALEELNLVNELSASAAPINQ